MLQKHTNDTTEFDNFGTSDAGLKTATIRLKVRSELRSLTGEKEALRRLLAELSSAETPVYDQTVFETSIDPLADRKD